MSSCQALLGPQNSLFRRRAISILRFDPIRRKDGLVSNDRLFFERKAVSNELQSVVYSHLATIHEQKLRPIVDRFQLFIVTSRG